MPDLVTMGANAAQIYRVALSTVSNNIANVGNDIYSRQQTILTAGAPAKVGVINIGTGANLDYIYRSYNEFIESSLRNSNSAVKTQDTLINYTSRIVDIMASDQGNLINAIDDFYSSLNRLELDPANIGNRNELLSSGQYLASRVNELATEVANIRADSQGEIEKNIVSINKIAESLFNVNQELNRNTSIKLQSPSMLDQRDNLLSQLSDYVDLNVTENENGTVVVRISGPANRSTLVDTVRQRQLGIQKHSLNSNVQGLVVDTYSSPTFIGIPKSGVLAGLMQLDNEVTQRLTDELNIFAKNFVESINAHHRSGLDLTNNLGQDMFQIAPNYIVKNMGGVTDDSFLITGMPTEEINPFSIKAADKNYWEIKDLMTDSIAVVKSKMTDNRQFIDYKGLSVQLPPAISEGAVYLVSREKEAAQELVFNLDDPRKIAAAARLHVKESSTNSDRIEVSINYSGNRAEVPVLKGLDVRDLEGRNVLQTVRTNGTDPSLSVPPQFGDFNFTLMGSLEEALNIQVLNNDFIKLAGSEALTGNQLTDIINSKIYGNKRFVDASADPFPGKDLYIGAKANFELLTERANAQVTGGRISAGAIKLNGHDLTQLDLQISDTNHPKAIASWINANSTANNLGVSASAINKIRVEPEGIDFTKNLSLNGTAINQSIDLKDLVRNINTKTDQTGVRAYLNNEQKLILTNDFGQEGASIEVSGSALGIAQSIFTGQIEFKSSEEINFTLGANGSSIDFARIGLPITVSGTNATDNSLHFYVANSAGAMEVGMKVGRSLPPPEPQVESPFTLEFVEDNGGLCYQIKDTATCTTVLEQVYVPATEILFGKLEIKFDIDPKAGDLFTFSKNVDAFGDNRNLRMLSATENEEIYNGFSARTYYSNMVNKVGSVVDLAKLNKDAADILYDENRVKKSSLSGVNLDQEAAELMRYQQAFQASAQLIQVSTKLFDAIISAS